jgi:hypothetical protein
MVVTTPISAFGTIDFQGVLSGVFGQGFVTAPLAPIGPIDLSPACLAGPAAPIQRDEGFEPKPA